MWPEVHATLGSMNAHSGSRRFAERSLLGSGVARFMAPTPRHIFTTTRRAPPGPRTTSPKRMSPIFLRAAPGLIAVLRCPKCVLLARNQYSGLF